MHKGELIPIVRRRKLLSIDLQTLNEWIIVIVTFHFGKLGAFLRPFRLRRRQKWVKRVTLDLESNQIAVVSMLTPWGCPGIHITQAFLEILEQFEHVHFLESSFPKCSLCSFTDHQSLKELLHISPIFSHIYFVKSLVVYGSWKDILAANFPHTFFFYFPPVDNHSFSAQRLKAKWKGVFLLWRKARTVLCVDEFGDDSELLLFFFVWFSAVWAEDRN